MTREEFRKRFTDNLRYAIVLALSSPSESVDHCNECADLICDWTFDQHFPPPAAKGEGGDDSPYFYDTTKGEYTINGPTKVVAEYDSEHWTYWATSDLNAAYAAGLAKGREQSESATSSHVEPDVPVVVGYPEQIKHITLPITVNMLMRLYTYAGVAMHNLKNPERIGICANDADYLNKIGMEVIDSLRSNSATSSGQIGGDGAVNAGLTNPAPHAAVREAAAPAEPICDCGKVEHGRHHALCPASAVPHSEKTSQPAPSTRRTPEEVAEATFNAFQPVSESVVPELVRIIADAIRHDRAARPGMVEIPVSFANSLGDTLSYLISRSHPISSADEDQLQTLRQLTAIAAAKAGGA